MLAKLYQTCDRGMRSATPKLGTIMCWSASGAGLGHASVVEELNPSQGLYIQDNRLLIVIQIEPMINTYVCPYAS